MLTVANWTFLTTHAWAPPCIAQDPEMRLRDIAASRGGGWAAARRHAGSGAPTARTTAVVIAAEGASPDRPISVTARALAPISAAIAHAWKGRKRR